MNTHRWKITPSYQLEYSVVRVSSCEVYAVASLQIARAIRFERMVSKYIVIETEQKLTSVIKMTSQLSVLNGRMIEYISEFQGIYVLIKCKLILITCIKTRINKTCSAVS